MSNCSRNSRARVSHRSAVRLLVFLIACINVLHLLFEITPLDPLSYAATAVLVLAGALLAAYIPARRGAHVDPMSVLKTE